MRQFWRVIYPILIYFGMAVVAIRISCSTDAVFNTLLGALLTIPVLGYLFWKEQKRRGRSLLAGGLSWNMMGLTVLFGIAACIAVNNLISISHLNVLFPGFSEVSEVIYGTPMWLQVTAVGLVLPLVEELIFRGLGFARLRDSQSFWKAAVVSSLIFGIYHGNAVQFVYAFTLGLMMCWIYEQTGSFLGPLLFHQAGNLISVAGTEISSGDEAFGSGISLYIMTLAAIGLMLLVIKMMKKNIHKEELA